MAEPVCLLALGDAEDGEVTEWYAEGGEWVEKGDAVAAVDVDKVTVDVQAPASGYLAILAPEGTRVPVGGRIAYILAEGELAPGT